MERTIGDYFISDADDALGAAGSSALGATVVPGAAPIHAPAPAPVDAPAVAPGAAASEAAPAAPATAAAAPFAPVVAAAPAVVPAPAAPPAPPIPAAGGASRGQQLASVLDDLIGEDPNIHAAALVSLDGLTMASALPAGMEPDRVGAMSAAILGLGERAAAELGRGQLSQVIVEGADGYVALLAAGSYAVLTAIADKEAKLGLMLYEMRFAARRVADVLG
jgi:hypothetical protein